MYDFLSRTRSLIGNESLKKLVSSKIMIFGIGGVGSFTAEALVRSGISNITLFDGDIIDISNINRQLIATSKTVGRYKVDVMKERILEINPNADVTVNKCFFDKSNISGWDFSNYDYIIDAIDSISAKISIILKAKNENVKVISSMGTGNKFDPTKFKISDIYKTSVCPLARIMRRELKKKGIDKLKVVYSDEKPVINGIIDENNSSKRVVPSSIAFVPSVAGLIIASEVVKDIIYK